MLRSGFTTPVRRRDDEMDVSNKGIAIRICAVVALGAVGTTVANAGCGKDPDLVEDCSDCSTQDFASWGCWGGLIASAHRYKGSVCMPYASTPSQVCFECNVQYGTPTWSCNTVELLPCDEMSTDGYGGGLDETSPNPAEYDCTGWAPANEVWGTGSPTYVDADFVGDLVADPTPLAVCDEARVVPLAGGYFEVDDASSGTLLYELGLRDGDVIKTINDHHVSSVGRTADAFGIEFLENDETVYEVVVERGGNDVTLDIEISSPT
jgi:hypothetical protein